MDKHEFNIKVEQIKKLVSKGDFETAMKIADTIDWRRVRNANLLSMISSVYEKNAEYQEAKDILLIAFERAPIGKRLLYKLTQLALKEGDIEEAETYYREFCDLAEDDSRQDILRYLILKAKGAPIEQLIHSLESYTSIELDEKWLYELADLYHQAGKEDECVKTCDKIMLMFGLGQYVDKAMELKLQYAPLTRYQMDLVENRDKYEEKLRQVEKNGAGAAVGQTEYDEQAQQTASREAQEQAAAARRGQLAAMEAGAAVQPSGYEAGYGAGSPLASGYGTGSSSSSVSGYGTEPSSSSVSGYGTGSSSSLVSGYGTGSSSSSGSGYGAAQRQPVAYPEAAQSASPVSVQSSPRASEEEMVSNITASFAAAAAEPQGASVSPEDTLAVRMEEAEVEANLAQEMSKISIDSYSEEPVREKTRVLQNVKDLKKAEDSPEKTKILAEIRHIQAVKTAEEQDPVEAVGEVRVIQYRHLMVEARTPEKGLEIAVAALKKTQQIFSCKHPVAKISGEKLNQKGVLASAPKLAGKDLIVEEAGDLCDAMLEELDKLLAEGSSEMQVVLIDNPRQIEGIRRINPSLARKFHFIKSAEEAEEVLLRLYAQQKNGNAEKSGQGTVRSAVPERKVIPVRPNPSEQRAESIRPTPSEQSTAPARPNRSEQSTAPVRPTSAEQKVVQVHPNRSEQSTAPVRPNRSEQSTAPIPSNPSGQSTVSARLTPSEQKTASVRPNSDGQKAALVRSNPADTGEMSRQQNPAQAGVLTEDTKVFRKVNGQGNGQGRTPISANGAVPTGDTQVRMAPIRTMPVRAVTPSEPVQSEKPSAPVRTETISDTSNTNTYYAPEEVNEPDDGHIMDIDEFAQYCCHYASQIDCNISGKSMLALYERIEIMEEDGVELTKTAAEDLIEEAADRAEKPSLGKRITGLFSSKYDKEGLLILKEEHFI